MRTHTYRNTYIQRESENKEYIYVNLFLSLHFLYLYIDQYYFVIVITGWDYSKSNRKKNPKNKKNVG